jgi:hypothetical protein
VGVGVRAALGAGARAGTRATSSATMAAISNYRNGGGWSPGLSRYPD